MALILCGECGKTISDKAHSCPGCGYPLQPSDANRTMQIDLKTFSKEQLWAKAYNMQYKYKDKKADIPTAIEIYNYIIEHFNGSKESDNAKVQLNILTTQSPRTQTVASDSAPEISKSIDIQKNNQSLKEYYKILGLEESASIEEVTSAYNELSDKWNPIKYEVHERSMLSFAEHEFKEIHDAYNRINQQLTGDYQGSNIVEDEVDNNDSKSSSPIFALVSVVTAIFAIIILYQLFYGGHGGLGSQYYKGNIDAFVNDNVERVNSISTVIKIFAVLFGMWFVMLISRIVCKK
jgi:hypothetical protein